MTARGGFPTQQRHQNVHRYLAATTDELNRNFVKTRRGKRNINTRHTKFENWKILRRENCRYWRAFKTLGSEAVRKVVAASLPGIATQEPNLLTHTQTKLNEMGYKRPEATRKLMKKQITRICRKKKKHTISKWVQISKTHDRRKKQKEYSKMKRRLRILAMDKDDGPPNTPKQLHASSPYAQKWCLGTLNCRGLNEQGKREQIMEIMNKLNIDILALQETKVNYCSEEVHTRTKSKERLNSFSAPVQASTTITCKLPMRKQKLNLRAKLNTTELVS